MSKSSLTAANDESNMNENERLKAVRDLIFGEDMQAYQREFASIRELMNQHQQLAGEQLGAETTAISDRLQSLEKSLGQTIDKIQLELESQVQRLEGINAELLANRRDVGKALAAVAEILQQ